MRLTLLLLAAALPSGPAWAEVVWRIDPEASSIRFDYALAGVAQTGRFTTFAGEGLFREARPQDTRFTLRIEADSLDLGNPLYSAFATSADWFDTDNHPDAAYRLSRLTLEPDGTATALGDLTIKGHLEVVEVPLRVEIGADRARARGSVAFDPRDFGVGYGPSALFVSLGDSVTVSFDLVARPEPEATASERTTP